MADATGLTIALDAMGGDHAPDAIVEGAVRALDLPQRPRILAVGRAAAIEAAIARHAGASGTAGVRSRIDIVDATEVVEMDEHPAQAVRAKRNSSVVRACELVATGRAKAVVSAGNSGAVLAAALFTVKRIPGVARPAIGALLPGLEPAPSSSTSAPTPTSAPEWLAQFAVMGSIYARTMMGVDEPRVALLSNGEEPGKGSALVQPAHPLLAARADALHRQRRGAATS